MLNFASSTPKHEFLSPCRVLASFIVGLFNLYEDLFFTYLEINPLGRFIIVPCVSNQ